VKLTDDLATVSTLPWHDADGYSYGGSVVLTIGERSILLGPKDKKFADDIARRWNTCRRAALEQSEYQP
jgi:hypothetical protein